MHLTAELINRLIKINKTEGRNTQLSSNRDFNTWCVAFLKKQYGS